tara:strand:- start:73 stop:402 length:330 start_codon:yes stop_codon:yes gene_type:complete
MIDINKFNELELRVGEIIKVELFPEAKTPAYKLKISFGKYGDRWSSAQITNNYNSKDLIGRQIIAAMNLGTKKIGEFKSEILVMGVDDNNGFVRLLSLNRKVENGAIVN